MSLLVNNPNETQRVELPDGEWVDIPKAFTFEMQQQFTPKTKDADVREISQKLLLNAIKAWSAKDENGVQLPITPENINKLDVRVVSEILNRVQEMMGLKKTNLQS